MAKPLVSTVAIGSAATRRGKREYYYDALRLALLFGHLPGASPSLRPWLRYHRTFGAPIPVNDVIALFGVSDVMALFGVNDAMALET